MATLNTLNKMSLNNLVNRAAKNGIDCDDMSKEDLVNAIFAAENVTSESVEIVAVESEEIVIDNEVIDDEESAFGVNEISESGEFAVHNIERTISSMKTLRAAMRKMVDAAVVNGEFERTLKTVNGEATATVKFVKGVKGAAPTVTFTCEAFATNDQRAFYAHMKAKFSLTAK